MAHAVDLDEAGAGNEGSGPPPATRFDESVPTSMDHECGQVDLGQLAAARTIVHDSSHLPTDPYRTEATIVGGTGAGSDELLVEPLRLGSVHTKCGNMMVDVGRTRRGRRGGKRASAASELSPYPGSPVHDIADVIDNKRSA